MQVGVDGAAMFDLTDMQLEYVTDSAGEKRAIILPIAVFYELLEDLADLAAVAERAGEPTVAHKNLIDELKAESLLPD